MKKPQDVPTICPFCGKINPHHLDKEGDDDPREGDISMCFDCGRFAIFTFAEGRIRLREPTEEEWRETMNHPDFAKVARAVQKADDAMQAARLLKEGEE